MEDLKSIKATDVDEQSALDFLNIDKSTWTINEQNDEYKLTYASIQMENPLTKTKEEKLSFCIEVTLKYPVEKVIKCLNDLNVRKEFD